MEVSQVQTRTVCGRGDRPVKPVIPVKPVAPVKPAHALDRAYERGCELLPIPDSS